MATRTYYYIKPKPSAEITFGKPTPLKLAVSAAAPNMAFGNPLPLVGAKTGLMDFDFADESEILHKPRILTQQVLVSRTSAWLRVLILVVAVTGMYFGGLSIAHAAVGIKDDITGLANKGVVKLQDGAGLMAQKNFAGARDDFAAAENLFSQAQQEILDLGQTNLYLSGLNSADFQVIAGQKLIAAGINLAQSGQLLIQALNPAMDYLNQVNAGGGDPQQYPQQIANLLATDTPAINQILVKVAKANQLLDSIDTSTLDPTYAQAVNDAREKTANLKNLTQVLATLAQQLPRELGFGSPSMITVLNQNNDELRPTGGFLGSIVNVQLYKGQVKDMAVDITQRIDGQNPNPSLPLPAPLRAVAWSGTWGTRDSNYFENFATSATTFEKLYQQAKGGTSDMIIAINPTIIEDILRIVGPIALPNKKLTLTADNFVTLSEQQIEVTDQNTQNPKEIFNQFAPLLMDKVMHASGDQLKQINSAFMHRLQTKDIMLYAKNKDMQDALTKLNFAGVTPAISGDFLSVIRTNLGATKSSQHVTQTITHVANVDLEGNLEDNLTLSYTHTGSNTFPDGVNKDYIRVYVPKGSQLVSLAGFDPGTNFDVFEEDGKTVFGAWLTTQPGETKELNIDYKPQAKVTNSDYQLYMSRQSGAGNTTFTSTLRLSPALQFDKSTLARSRQLFTGSLDTDLNLSQAFVKNL